ncbi:MAG: 16S rRNA (guanine(966)-N(2))-methyltransferase RsmD [Deltaproteobacteria bacterium]|jgi:16S rRNA (guanine966-N2)-methyltransferase|nr:16S rRNA (guanine(966)-N(2))-methyltransferase RsmD [Deltaproteobacteria bacterium]
MRIIGGELRGRTLRTVEGPGYRPATGRVREALFSMLEARGLVWPECSVLDLFAGSGSLAFESASRGARLICLVENSACAVRCLERNAAAFGLFAPRCRILREDVLRLLARRNRKGRAEPAERFDVVFMDPPYGLNLVPVALQALVRGRWLAPEAFVLAEAETQTRIGEAAQEGLALIGDRAHGQTRVLLWQAQ